MRRLYKNKKIIPFLFCAGQGTRLRPITLETPKPLIPIRNGKRIIDYNLNFLLQEGFKKVLINYSYKEDLFKKLQEEYKSKLEILLIKDNPLTGHWIILKNNTDKIKEYKYILGINGDTIIDFDLEDFIKKHKEYQSNFSILYSDKINSSKVLLGLEKEDNTLDLVGLKTEKGNLFYLGEDIQDIQAKNNLGVYLIDTKIINKLNTKQEFAGFFGEDDLVENALKNNFKVKLINNISIKNYISINNIQELNIAKQKFK